MYTYSTWWCGMIRPSPTSSLFPYTTLFRSIQKAQIALALCDGKLSDEMEKTRAVAPALQKVVYWGSGQPDGLERSEEHTSELQSRGHLVCRLLLEKKTW